MNRIKSNWDIEKNWQLIYIVLGVVGLLFSGYFVAINLIPNIFEDAIYEFVFVCCVTLILAYLFYRLCLYFFGKLYDKWGITKKYRMVAIFIVFAITGSLSARLSSPLLHYIGLDQLSKWIYWPVRLLIIFPIYQILLVAMGWLFGQFEFFWWFEKKMLSRFGIKL
ncbi:DUF6787 family protein [Nonlabens tegetincola]|uniref:DUF6787 family protein n=1 Tax=Nonlabens tegetincola TaxID=323273 RepID=UPI000CF36417|nr:DUF6787 family protein [Nonlabens tegetincola]PQJ17114.1 prolipoprotein diacylglyceryl transferase [Nonlabens tegetincola]